MSKNIMYSFLGTQLDGGFTEKRLLRWRPNVGISQSVDLVIDTLVLMFDQRHQALAEIVAQDARDLAVREGFEVELLQV
ncbi:RNA repair transcriptional activator RtcR family protein, partial [Salmonella enterica]|uniref:RNA repair transcriptional activator RtcR family protein n=1 Tax=Salmonella enterica TaxID=28901 RepID=UPI001914C973